MTADGSAFLAPPRAPSMRQQRASTHGACEARFGAFVRERLQPTARQRDRDGTPLSREQVTEACALGLATLRADRAHGGGGASLPEWALTLEWLGAECEDLAVPTLLGYRHAAGALLHELALGRVPGAAAEGRAVAARWADAVARGQATVSVAYTEGADPFSFRTRASPTEDGYLVHGTKTWVAGGLIADAVLTFAAGPDNELLAFVIERDDPGVSFAARDLMGMRSLGVAQFTLHEVKVPRSRLLLDRDALTAAQRFFNERRLTMPLGALGRATRLFEQGVADLSQRLRYRLPVTEMQAVQSRLGQIHVAIETARTVIYDAVERADESDPVWDAVITTAKYFAIQQLEAAVRGLSYVLGGAAYDRALPYERGLRDLHAFLHLAGTQATLEVDLGVKAIAAVEQAATRRRKRAVDRG